MRKADPTVMAGWRGTEREGESGSGELIAAPQLLQGQCPPSSNGFNENSRSPAAPLACVPLSLSFSLFLCHSSDRRPPRTTAGTDAVVRDWPRRLRRQS